MGRVRGLKDGRLDPVIPGMDVVWVSGGSKVFSLNTRFRWGTVVAIQGRSLVVQPSEDSPGPSRPVKVRAELCLVDRRADFVNTSRLFEDVNTQAGQVREALTKVTADLAKANDQAGDAYDAQDEESALSTLFEAVGQVLDDLGYEPPPEDPLDDPDGQGTLPDSLDGAEDSE